MTAKDGRLLLPAAPLIAWLLGFAYAPLFGLAAAFQRFSWKHPFAGPGPAPGIRQAGGGVLPVVLAPRFTFRIVLGIAVRFLFSHPVVGVDGQAQHDDGELYSIPVENYVDPIAPRRIELFTYGVKGLLPGVLSGASS